MLPPWLSRVLFNGVGVLVLLCGSAEASLLVYEPFNYPLTGGLDRNGDGLKDLMGQGSGLGLTGTWNEEKIGSDALTPWDYLLDGDLDPTSVTAAYKSPSPTQFLTVIQAAPGSNIAQAQFSTISLATPIVPATTPVIWVSFLSKMTHAGYPTGGTPMNDPTDFFSLQLVGPDQSRIVAFGDGDESKNWAVQGADVDYFSVTGESAIPIALNSVTFLVAKITFLTGGESKFELFVNPAPGASAPSVASATAMGYLDGVNSLRIGIGGSPFHEFQMDEIRLGTEWGDVAVPEPGTAAMLLASMGLLSMRRRQRR